MSETEVLPPRPTEVLDEDRISFQAMTDLGDNEYQRLADDIRERGVLQPIIVDEDGTILDGHHRAALAEHLDLDASREPAYVVIGDLDDEGEKLARAIKQNVIGRDTEQAVKTQAVEHYIDRVWDTTDDGDFIRPETDTKVADKLGVDRSLVSKVIKNVNRHIIYHDRVEVQKYYEDNPDASYREVARQVHASQPTVTEWLKEDFDEGNDSDETDDDTSLVAFATGDSEANKAAATFEKAAESDDSNAADVAEENADRLARGETSPTTASKNVEKAEAKEKVEEQKDTDSKKNPVVEKNNATALIESVDTADALITDPPYTTDVDDIDNFVSEWLPKAIDTIGDSGIGFITVGAYSDELNIYLDVLDKCGVLDRTQVMVWTYKNTLGRTPNEKYKRNWQAILFIQSDPPIKIDAPMTSEQWAVQDINAPDGRHDNRHHKWEKPTELIERFVRHTTQEGDHIIDPFAGTGTTAIVGSELGRDVTAGDNDASMLEIAEDRGCVIDE